MINISMDNEQCLQSKSATERDAINKQDCNVYILDVTYCTADEFKMVWELTDTQGKIVPPRMYSNGKSQESVVNEVIAAFEDNKFVVLIGGVGTGKSAIALQVIKHFNKSGIIVVPTKVLEHQYQDDYCGNSKYHIPDLEVEYMVGKGNFRCKYVHDKWSCTHSDEPCNIPLDKDKKESRLRVASVCPYWSPIYPLNMARAAEEALPRNIPQQYVSISGQKIWYCASDPCGYYYQFAYYTKQCALLMNSAKWEIETAIGRKPAVEIEIIDEADEFLDGLSYQTRIDAKFFESLKKENFVEHETISALKTAFDDIIFEHEGYEGKLQDDILLFVQRFVEAMEECPTSSFAFDKVAKMSQILEDALHSYACIMHNAIIVFMPRPDITLQKIFSNSKRVLFMSATIQSRQTLKEIFGIEPHFVIAEDVNPGLIKIKVTGQECMVTYTNWQLAEFQERYHRLLSRMVEVATKPCLVQVHAKKYVPPEHASKLIDEYFKDGTWWSTRTDRGVDLPGDKCRSIILMKYPMPDMNDVVLKTMRQLLGEGKFWMYMNDMATRNLIQQCGRGVRSNDDWCEVYSPDSKCLSILMKNWNGKKVIERVRIPIV
jgi:Rad3-related DNA helicase